MLDLILAGGEVFDGTGAEAFNADIGLKDGRIACIGDLSDQGAEERLGVDPAMRSSA